ncbi:MAG: hypothetical protein MOGMAGMI_02441 [Candidatus Omnitrophica bacterium]|nr:hypothetical protein [Candidatus Omnitrophota bacterium]
MTSPQLVTRAVGYARVSTDEQVAEGLSLDAQAQAIRHYCALRHLELVTLLTDPAVSAGTPLAARPAGRELAELVTARRVGAVVALRLDRLFRDAGDCLAVTRRWDAAGVALHLLDLGGQTLDTSSAMGRFFLTVMAGAAELERNLNRERTRLSYAHLRQSGVYHSSVVPIGYRREPAVIDGKQRHRFVVDEATAPFVRELFDRYLAGEQLVELARWSNDAYPRADGLPPSWPTVLRFILNNPVYIARVPHGRQGDRRPGVPAVNVEPLVDESVWQAVQQLLAVQTRIHPRARSGDGCFGGLLTCGACGAPMWRSGGQPGYIYYRCSQARLGRCDQRNVRDVALWEELLPHLVDHLDPRRARQRQAEADPAQEAASLRLAAIGEELQRLTSVYTAAGRLGEREFLAAAEALWQERDALEASRAEQAAPLPMTLPPTRRELRAVLDRLSPDERGVLLRRVLVSATVKDGRLVGAPRLR